jgi:type IV pilus assembly protein PilO
MENFSEMSSIKQWGAIVMGALVVTTGLYFGMFKSQNDANAAAQKKLDAKLQENRELESYRPKLKQMQDELVSLKQQLDIERRIVPDEKEADNFIRMLDAEAIKAGVEIRSYSSDPVSTKEFYTAVPFQLELDGPYYAVLNFFDRVSKLERIVNVSNLMMATPKKAGDAKVKHTYEYAPNESVVVSCLTTTFFSHDLHPGAQPQAQPQVKKGGKTL